MTTITENLLKLHRDADGDLNLDAIPRRLFTATWSEDRPSWLDFGVEGLSSMEEIRQALKVVPVLAFTKKVPFLGTGREWVGLQHQSGGHACEQLYMVATPLDVPHSLLTPLRHIAQQRYNRSHFFYGDIEESDIESYNSELAELSLDCCLTWPLLTESIYPIDASAKNLGTVAPDQHDLLGLVEDKPSDLFASDAAILLLTQNSD